MGWGPGRPSLFTGPGWAPQPLLVGTQPHGHRPPPPYPAFWQSCRPWCGYGAGTGHRPWSMRARVCVCLCVQAHVCVCHRHEGWWPPQGKGTVAWGRAPGESCWQAEVEGGRSWWELGTCEHFLAPGSISYPHGSDTSWVTLRVLWMMVSLRSEGTRSLIMKPTREASVNGSC